MSVIDGFIFDAFTSELENNTSRLTKFPRETLSEISDHRIKNPLTLQITGIVSFTPLESIARVRGEDTHRITDARTLLEDLDKTGRAVLITTSTKIYSDMVLISLRVPGDRSTGNSFKFTATFQKTITVDVNKEVEDILIELPRAKPKQKNGDKLEEKVKATEEAKVSEAPERSSSLLKQGADAAIKRWF